MQCLTAWVVRAVDEVSDAVLCGCASDYSDHGPSTPCQRVFMSASMTANMTARELNATCHFHATSIRRNHPVTHITIGPARARNNRQRPHRKPR
jgi:hypothetical protein